MTVAGSLKHIRNEEDDRQGQKLRLTHVGIIGEGKMGTGIFNYLLDFPLKLTWLCSLQADTEKMNRQLHRRLARAGNRDLTAFEGSETHYGAVITSDPVQLTSCDLIIEAIAEDLTAKKNLFERLEQIINPNTIVVTNSSSINPSELAPSPAFLSRFAGMHFFYPVAITDIVELIHDNRTCEHVVSQLRTFLNSIGKRYIELDERNSFILNRIFLDVQNEAFRIMEEVHCSAAQIDNLVKAKLFPFGIFDFCDNVGTDTMLVSIRNYIKDYPHEEYYKSFVQSLESLVQQGKLGVKTGAGFYDYSDAGTDDSLPQNPEEIVTHLRQTWLSSVRRYTRQSLLTIDEMNDAVKEYFGLDQGPFEIQGS